MQLVFVTKMITACTASYDYLQPSNSQSVSTVY